jgi:hypothetical protein
MVAHSSDMQDPSPHTILRPLQDTALPLPPCHYSYILRCTTPDSSLPHHINTNDPRLRLFLTTLPCTALGYGRPPLQVLVIQSQSRHSIWTAMPIAIFGRAIPASRMEFSVGGSLHGLAKASTARKRCRTPGAPSSPLSLSVV